MKSITIRIPDELKRLIEEEADASGKTLSEYLREILEMHIGGVSEESQRDFRRDLALSAVERDSLSLGYQILLAIHGDLPREWYDAESTVHKVKALEGGYAGEYPRILPDADEETSPEECRLVWDILDMFRVIKYSIRDLGEGGWEQTGVINAELYGSFQGFDHQSAFESKLADYVDYLVETGRWTEQKEFLEAQGGNSHHEMLPTYRSMLAEFKPVWRKAIGRGGRPHLTSDEIRRVLLAASGAHLKQNKDAGD